MDTGRAVQMLQLVEQLYRVCFGVQNVVVVRWTEVDDVDWPGGVYLCSQEGAHVVWQPGGMAQLEA